MGNDLAVQFVIERTSQVLYLAFFLGVGRRLEPPLFFSPPPRNRLVGIEVTWATAEVNTKAPTAKTKYNFIMREVIDE